MANTLTDLTPDIYEALDIVGREMVGFVPAVMSDSSAERAAKDQSVRVPVSPAASAEDITPGTNPPDTGDQTFGNVEVKITKSRAVPFRWTGEEQRGVDHGPGYANLRRDQIAQALRTLVNEVESDLGGLYVAASRAYGTAATAPFGTASDLSDIAQVRKILDDNGTPQSDLQLVLGSAAIANLRGKQSQLFKVNEAGSEDLLRRGVIGNIEGFNVHNSAAVKAHTKGTGTSYLINNGSDEPVGETTLTLDTGSGTIIAGDILTHASDSVNKYVVATALSGNDVVIAEPGLLIQADDDDAVTVGNSYTANMAFHRNALVLVARQPALPDEGDLAADRMTVTDPVSGLSFEFAIYPQYRRVRYEVGLSWGVKCIKPEHTAILLG